ncbi:MAG: DUF1223 domain-containing protein [Alphaproteobacteria bacterium]|nr:DUF1223 domain-containing protein [Alphaproteobacteria bacterium]
MRFIFTSLFLAVLAFASPLAAADRPVVVELFTSQGCSSCPAADKILAKLAKQDNVIALSLHVDYWDYLGWKDSFAKAMFSMRQRAYARAAQKHTIYTPQVVVQGASHAIGNREQDVNNLIKFHAAQTKAVALDVARYGNDLIVNIRAISGPVGAAVVEIVRYMPERTVDIRAGENAGRKIVYTNIVTDWQPMAQWNGRSGLTVKTTITGTDPVVILVQSKDYGPIIAAKVLR